MATYKIHPLEVARLGAPVGILSMGGDMQTFMVAPVLIFYIEGGGKKIVMDAGIEAPDEQGVVHGFPVVGGGGAKGVRTALQSVGTTPEEIDYLVLSHLHFDHCTHASLFKNARVILQKREWETAFHPVPTSRQFYESSLFRSLEGMDLVLVDGEFEVAEGVNTLFLPGHTQGLQGLAVDTAFGTAVLTGDQCYSYYNLDPTRTKLTDLAGTRVDLLPRPDLPFLPAAIFVNLIDWYDSMWKVVARASSRDLVIPGHDPSIAGKVFG